MPGRRRDDVSLTQLQDDVKSAEIKALQAQAEARAARDEITKKFERLENTLTTKIDNLKDSIAAFKIKTLSEDKKERKEIRIERWQVIVGVFGILVYGAVMPSLLNVERMQKAWMIIASHFRKAENTQVPLLMDTRKRPRHRRPKKKVEPLPPIVVPEQPPESSTETMQK